MKFSSEARDPGSPKKRCIVRKANDEGPDQASHLWFVQERHKGTHFSSAPLKKISKTKFSAVPRQG